MFHIFSRMLTALCRNPSQSAALGLALLFPLLAEFPILIHWAKSLINWMLGI